MGRKLGNRPPPWGGGAGSPSNTIWPGTRPTRVPSFILIRPTVWPQYTNVVANIQFSNIHQNLLRLMHLRTYGLFCGGPAVDAYERADAAARRASRKIGTSCCIGTFGLSRNMYALLLTR